MKKINEKDPNLKVGRQLSIGYQSNNYRKLMRLVNDKSIPDKSIEELTLEIEMVMNMGEVDDPDQDFQAEYRELKVTAIDRLQKIIDSKKRVNTPLVLPNIDYFKEDLFDRAGKVSKLLKINYTRLVQKIENDIGLTMEFIKLADNYIGNTTSIIARTDLIKFLGTIGISQSTSDNLQSEFINTVCFLLIDYITYELGVVEEHSYKEARLLLEDAFTIPGFEDTVRDAYYNLSGEELINQFIKILIHFDVVKPNVYDYIKDE
jgi:hypothetical protein